MLFGPRVPGTRGLAGRQLQRPPSARPPGSKARSSRFLFDKSPKKRMGISSPQRATHGSGVTLEGAGDARPGLRPEGRGGGEAVKDEAALGGRYGGGGGAPRFSAASASFPSASV